MRPKVSLSGCVVLLGLIIMVSCGPALTPEAPLPTATMAARPSATKTPTPAATLTATPTATGSADAPRPVAAGTHLQGTTASNPSPQLVFDGAGQPHLYFITPDTSSGGSAYSHAQLGAGSAWSQPAVISPVFQFLSGLTAVPDASGGLCVVWSGEQYDAKGNAVYGLWRSCQPAAGDWPAAAEQLITTTQPTLFSPVRTAAGALVSVLITPAGPVEGLYFSALEASVTTPLTSTLLSSSQQVLFGRLAIDAAGGFHAAWVESSGHQDVVVQARDSKDNGKTWSPAEQLYSGTADNPAEISFQLVADPVGKVHLAWDADSAVHYRQWTAEAGWAPAVTLSGPKRSSGVALAATSAGLARAAWITAGANGGLFLSAQGTDGAWSAPTNITPTPVIEVTLAVDAKGTSQVVWRADDGLRYLALP